MFANMGKNTDIEKMSLSQFVLVHLVLFNESPQIEGKDRKVDLEVSTLELNILFPSFKMKKGIRSQCAVHKLPTASADANENLYALRL